jgi:hypothetical protein
MKNRLLTLVSLAAALMVVGCDSGQPRMKSIESYNNAVTPNDYAPVKVDPGSFGGIGSASGGTQPALSYGTHSASDPDDGSWQHFQQMAAVQSSGVPDEIKPNS